MNKILLVCFILASTIGCQSSQSKAEQTTQTTNKLRGDSIGTLIQEGMLWNDTSKLNRALVLIDEQLAADTTKNNKYFCYYSRSQILWLLNRQDEAMETSEQMMLLLPETSIDRLSFMMSKYIRENDKDSTDYYMAKAIEACEKALNNKFDGNAAIKKLEITYIKDGKEAALAYISDVSKEHPDMEPMLEFYKEMFESSNTNSDEFPEILNFKEINEGEMYQCLRNSYLKMHGK